MKRKILACVLACLTLFLGFGYAGWTDSLQITGTADTGELKVKFVDVRDFASLAEWGDPEFTDGWVVYTGIPGNKQFAAQYFADSNYNDFDNGNVDDFEAIIANYTKTTSDIERVSEGALTADPVVDDNYVNGAITNDGIKITLNELYPGYAQLFKTDILNAGTIAAKLADIDLDVTLGENTDESVLDMVGVALDVYNEDGDKIVNMLKDLDDEDFFNFKGVKFIRLSALERVEAGNLGDMLYIYPSDDNTMDVVFGVAMDPDWAGVYTTGRVTDTGVVNANNTDADTQNGLASFNINFKWDQMNAPGAVPTA